MKLPRLQSKVVTLGVWKWQGMVLRGGAETEFVAYVKELTGQVIEVTNAAGRAYLRLGIPWFLWVADAQDVPCLAHEALHITGGLLDIRGLKYSADSEEAWTYTMEHIIACALESKGWETVRLRDRRTDRAPSKEGTR